MRSEGWSLTSEAGRGLKPSIGVSGGLGKLNVIEADECTLQAKRSAPKQQGFMPECLSSFIEHLGGVHV